MLRLAKKIVYYIQTVVRVPLVDGTSCPPVRDVACLRASAIALKAHSDLSF